MTPEEYYDAYHDLEEAADALAAAVEAEHVQRCTSYPPCEPARTWSTGEWIDPPYDCPVALALAEYRKIRPQSAPDGSETAKGQ